MCRTKQISVVILPSGSFVALIRSKLHKLSQTTRSALALIFAAQGGRRKMVNRDTLPSAYRGSIMRFQKLLKTHLTDEEHDYIKQRLSACKAAVKALVESETVRK
jgi:hypothetical protein